MGETLKERRDTSTLELSLNALDTAVSTLGGSVDELTKQLDPVIVETPWDPIESNVAEKDANHSSTVTRINGIRDNISEIRGKVNHVMASLEI